ncbi:MAG: hypothetical protein V4671_08140 [Armatimonadota bacterium]
MAYPQEATGPSARGDKGAHEDLVAFLQECRVEDIVAIQALAYCGARYFSHYEEALEAARQDVADTADTEEQSCHFLAGKRFLADWLRAGLICDEKSRAAN